MQFLIYKNQINNIYTYQTIKIINIDLVVVFKVCFCFHKKLYEIDLAPFSRSPVIYSKTCDHLVV